MRINVRLDEQTEIKLRYMLEHTGDNTPMAIKQAIHHYFDLLSETQVPAEIMGASGFIGCVEGEEVLSMTYKKALTESLDTKHDHR